MPESSFEDAFSVNGKMSSWKITSILVKNSLVDGLRT